MNGTELIAVERRRQVVEENYTVDHDRKEHNNGELLDAALCYATEADGCSVVRPRWPWAPDDWKPSADPIRNLAKAGALIAAEIDRRQKASDADVIRSPVPATAAASPKCILQNWVTALGLRHQGVLLTAVRGCDTAPKDDPSKLLTRCLRAEILNAHCGDATRAATFIQAVHEAELRTRMRAVRKNLDHYPHHYVMHLVHAVEIIGYKSPGCFRQVWLEFYFDLVRGLHLNPEREVQLDTRLNADEATFQALDAR